MIIGIDVGGTHADGVLLNNGVVQRKKKVAVESQPLEETIIALLDALLPAEKSQLTQIQLSTTLCTNALLTGNLARVGMFIEAGPGINPDFLQCGSYVHYLNGSIDHRGIEQKAPDLDHIDEIMKQWHAEGVDSVGIVTKFSHRNNRHEKMLGEHALDIFPHISLGHQLSGLPNFPRRVYTTWLNSSLKKVFAQFKEGIAAGMKKHNISCPVFLLKADGGTMPFTAAGEFPCQTVHSGPSASVMGCLALHNNGPDDTILLDIGGTTTDIALFSEGIPLLEPYGVTVGGRPTLIRALYTRSVPIGGDSTIIHSAGAYVIGPKKAGAAMAFGGDKPTPTDAMITLGYMKEGDVAASRKAMAMLDDSRSIEETAQKVLDIFCNRIHETVTAMIDTLFSRPVFTVTALLEREKLEPTKIMMIGGPAMAIQEILAQKFKLPCTVPPDFEVANAIGAARARQTVQLSLYCDTELNRLSIPELSLEEAPGQTFNLEDARTRLIEAVEEVAEKQAITPPYQIDIVEEFESSIVRGFNSTGKIFSLKAQLRPGLVEE